MKSIIYILITVFISSILISAIPKKEPRSKQTIELQCVDENYSKNTMIESADIIKSRLEDAGYNKVNISIDKTALFVDLSSDNQINLENMNILLTSKGRIEFFETHSRNEIIQGLENEKDLITIMNIPTKNRDISNLSSNSVLGYSIGDNKETINNHLNALNEGGVKTSDINFSWCKFPTNNSDFELFLLKHGCSLNGANVANSMIKNYDNGEADIIISFNEKGAKLWQEMTRRNIGKSIAIVIDGEVYNAPKVMSEIKEGKCQISGNFTTNEVNRLISLINNGELPLKFELKK